MASVDAPHKVDTSVAIAPWRVRLRFDGVGHTITLPLGRDTTFLQLKRLAVELVVTQSARNKNCDGTLASIAIKKGFPPVPLQELHSKHAPSGSCGGGGSEGIDNVAIPLLGVENMDSLVVEDNTKTAYNTDSARSETAKKRKVAKDETPSTSGRKSGLQESQKRVSTIASLSDRNGGKSRAGASSLANARRRKQLFKGRGVKLGSSDVHNAQPTIETHSNRPASASRTNVKQSERIDDLLNTDTHAMLGDVSEIAKDLVGSVRAGNDSTVRHLYDLMRNAVTDRLRESEGIAKVAAAETGNISFSNLSDGSGRTVVRWKAGVMGVMQGSNSGEDVFQVVPRILCPLVLASLVTDKDSDMQIYLKKPECMAMASPRMFWSIVMHFMYDDSNKDDTEKSEQSSVVKRTFAEALASLLPGYVGEADVGKRESKKPERYANYVSHGPGTGRSSKEKK